MKKYISVLCLLVFTFPLFASAETFYKDSSGKIWAFWNGKRRQIRSEQVLNSYSPTLQNISDLSIGKMGINNLIRVKDKPEVFALNDLGFKRHIHNPEIFSSYELSWEDVADINETELNSLPDCYLIKEATSDKVYYLSGTTLQPIKDLATFNHNGYKWEALQIINSEDLKTYQIGSELSYSEPIEQPVVYGTPTPSVSPSPSVSPTPSPVASAPEVRKRMDVIQEQIENCTPETRCYHFEVQYFENGQIINGQNVTISGNEGENFTGSPRGQDYFCSGGSPVGSNGQVFGNPISCETGQSRGANFQYVPISKELRTITFSVNGLVKTLTLVGQK